VGRVAVVAVGQQRGGAGQLVSDEVQLAGAGQCPDPVPLVALPTHDPRGLRADLVEQGSQ
jgi:hypothetical protein